MSTFGRREAGTEPLRRSPRSSLGRGRAATITAYGVGGDLSGRGGQRYGRLERSSRISPQRAVFLEKSPENAPRRPPMKAAQPLSPTAAAIEYNDETHGYHP